MDFAISFVEPDTESDDSESSVKWQFTTSVRGVQSESEELTHLVGIDIYRELENKASKKHLNRQLKVFDSSLTTALPNCTWNCHDKAWVTEVTGTTQEVCVPLSQVSDCVMFALRRVRKTASEKAVMMKRFGLETKEVKGPVECELLSKVKQALPFAMETNYRLGRYRLDAFIPRLRVAIEVDEDGHTHYDTDEENKRSEVMRDSNIVCLRFNPDLEGDEFALIKKIWTRSLSPDFQLFRQILNLV